MAAAIFSGRAAALPAQSQDLYEQGLKAFRAGNYGSAQLIFRKVIDNDDDFRDRAWFSLALSIYHQKKYDSSIFELNRFLLACTTANLCAEARFWIAESHYRRKDYIKAIEEHNRFLSMKTGDDLAAKSGRRIGDIYFIQGRYDEAVLVWKKVLESLSAESEKNSLTIKIGEALFLNENYEEASELLKPILRSKADAKTVSGARLIIGRVYQMENRHQKAMALFNAIPDPLIRRRPFYDVMYYKALSAAAMKNPNSAKSFLEFFLLIGRRSEWYHHGQYELGKLLLAEKKESEGMSLLESVRKSTTRMELRSKAAMELARVYLRENPRGAIPYLEDAVSLSDPEEQKNALMLLSRVYSDTGRYDDAERLLELLKSKYPYDSNIEEVQFLLSRVHLARAEYGKAREGFEALREMNPFSRYIPESYYYIAVAEFDEGRAGSAFETMRKYLSQPGSAKKLQAREKLCEWNLSAGNLAGARKALDEVMRYHGSDEDAAAILYRFGSALYEKNPSVRTHLDFVVKRYPQSENAGKIMMRFGDEAFRGGDYRTAERNYRQYLSVERREFASSVFLYRIISLYRLARYADVIRAVDEGPVPPSDDFTMKLIGQWKAKSHYHAGQPAKAYAILKDYDIVSFSEQDLSITARSALAAKDAALAGRATELLRRNNSMYAEGLYDLGRFYSDAGDHTRASGFFERILAECPDTGFADSARIEGARIAIAERRYADAVGELSKVKSAHAAGLKSSLLALSHFRLGDGRAAVGAMESSIEGVASSQYAEALFREAVEYARAAGDDGALLKYAAYLKKHPNTSDFINYHAGKLYFELGNFDNSYFYLYKLSGRSSAYRDEALYTIGVIGIEHQKNAARGSQYLKKLAGDGSASGEFVQKARLYLAMMAKEQGNDEVARDYLTDILGTTRDRLLRIQAMNLLEHFGLWRGDGRTE
jgi:tetratricopeptide (TPR) repeat protein